MHDKIGKPTRAFMSLVLLLVMGMQVLAVQTVTVPVGTVIPLKMDTYLSSDSSRVGDRFTATVSSDVAIDGTIVVPVGAKVEGHVTSVESAQRGSKAGTIAVAFDRLIIPDRGTIAVDGSLTTLDRNARRSIENVDDEDRVEGDSRTRKAVVFIGGGAGAGAVIGAVAGGAKGAAVGAGLGAVLGTIGVLVSKGDKADVTPGTEFGMMIERPFSVDSFGVAGDRQVYDDHGYGVEPVGQVSGVIYTSPEAIRAAQEALRDLRYYNGPINGTATAATQNAMRQFQRERNLTPTGELNFETARALGLRLSADVSDQAGDASFTRSEAIRSAQMVLRDRGYYTGPINGVMSPATQTAIRQFQRDRNLPLTGAIDRRTAQALGIASTSGSAATPVDIRNPRAERVGGDSIRIAVDAVTRGGGWDVFLDQFIQGDTLHAYVRGVPPRFPSTAAINETPINQVVSNTRGVRRVIFHGAERDITIDLVGGGGGGGGTGTGTGNPTQIAFLANRLLTSYSRDLNLRGNRGQVVFDRNRNLREGEVELLFNLYGLEAVSGLYARMVTSVDEPSALTGARDALLRQVRLVYRSIRRHDATLRLSATVRGDWDALRAELANLNISDTELDRDPDRR